MKPSQLASQLRRIASAIDNSKNPNRNLVARDLKRTLAALDSDDVFLKSMPDAMAKELQSKSWTANTQWTSGHEILYKVTFSNIVDISSADEGSSVDLVANFNSTHPDAVPPFSLHIDGVWEGDGTAPVSVVSGSIEPGMDEYLTIHVHSIIQRAWERVSAKINAQLDADGI